MVNVQTETSTSRAVHGPHFHVPANVLESPDLRTLQANLERIVSGCAERREAIDAYLNVARCLTNAVDVAYTLAQDGGTSSLIVAGKSDVFRPNDVCEQVLRWSTSACGENAVQLDRIEGRHETFVTLPVFVQGKATESITASLLVPRGEIEPFVVSLQLIATSLGAWYARQAASSSAFESLATSAIIELIGRTHDAQNVAEAAHVIANEMQKFTGCEVVAIALRRRGNSRVKVTAMSGSGVLDQRSDVVRKLTDAAEESLDRDGLTVWPPLSMEDRHSTRVHKQLVEGTRYKAVVSHPIHTDDDVLGAWLFLGDQQTLHQQSVLNVVRAASPHIATALAVRQQADAGPFTRVRKMVRGTPQSRRSRRAVLIGLLLTSLVMLIPIPHRIACDCTVEPNVRRFAAVPFNGVLRDSLVEPGDIVQANQVLARMDDRDLRFEKSESSKTREIALKDYDKQRAEHNVADAQIARLRAKEMDARLAWIQHREDNLDIRSPIAGVVLDGDLEDVQGATVQRGQTLFEVAPLDDLELKLAIPEDEFHYTDVDMTVTARLDGAPGKHIAAKLTRVTPRANADSGQNVFFGKATLDAQDAMLRPGMSGTAKVIGPKRAIGWILFHKAYRKITDMLEW